MHKRDLEIPLLDYSGPLAIDRIRNYVAFMIKRNVPDGQGGWRDGEASYFLTVVELKALVKKYYAMKAAAGVAPGRPPHTDPKSYAGWEMDNMDLGPQWFVSLIAYYDAMINKPTEVIQAAAKLEHQKPSRARRNPSKN